MRIMTIRVPDDMQERLAEISSDQGYTRNSLVLQILRDWLNKEGKEWIRS